MRITFQEAIALLKNREVIAIPTETVYGLAASINYPDAIEKIYQLKGRPPDNPLIMHVASVKSAYPFLSTIPPSFNLLADAFWPGPLTLVVPVKREMIPANLRSNLETQAFRIPEHPMALALLQETGPLAAPSANLSGKPSAVQAVHVENDFGLNFPVLDGGVCENGVESTILIWQEGKWRLGRKGAICPNGFMPVLGYCPEVIENQKLMCPGQKYRHYAPAAELILGEDLSDAHTILGFSDRLYPSNAKLIPFGNSQNPAEVLKNLFSSLRHLDENKILKAYIDINVPHEGLWLTFLERIMKSAGNNKI